MTWPAPPQQARIEFVQSITGSESLTRDTTFTEKVVNFLAGEQPSENRIAAPMAIAVSDDGQRLYVADVVQRTVFVFDLAKGRFTRVPRGREGVEPLAWPMGLALDAEERLYVAESMRPGISVFDRQGARIRTITHPSLERPTGVAIDRERGRIYVADPARKDSPEHTVEVFDLSGAHIRTIGKGKGAAPGQFHFPTHLALDAAGRLYVTDAANSRIQVFGTDGNHVRSVGQRGDAWGMFDKPKGVALDSFGNIYVVDSGWSNVQIFNERGQVLLFFGGRGSNPGFMQNPTAIAIDRQNQIYVGDFLNSRVGVYRLVNTRAEDSFLTSTVPQGGDVQHRTRQPADRAREIAD